MTECDLGPGEEALLRPLSSLWFVLVSDWGCLQPPKQGETLSSLDTFAVKVKVDLRSCQWRGVHVSLLYEKEQDEYLFSVTP